MRNPILLELCALDLAPASDRGRSKFVSQQEYNKLPGSVTLEAGDDFPPRRQNCANAQTAARQRLTMYAVTWSLELV